ncbi:MAG TPA: tellurite resistance TerB family protein [Geminicoccaceae bacterium]|nr:tellurite resistance TerB family protein [Geminicoccaceae bacterium]
MFNARDLLGQVMQAGMSGSAADRMRHAMGPKGLGQAGNPLAELFGQSGSGGGLGGLAGMAGSLFSDASRSVKRGDPLAVGGLGALAGAVLGGGRGAMRGAVGGGILALLGGLAMTALKNQTGTASGPDQLAKEAPLGLREPQDPGEEAELERTAQLVLRAMINAAKADGQIDAGEMQRIVGKLEEDGADDEARAFVLKEMQKPEDLDGLLRDVRSREVAVEVYAASLLAIEVDTPAERDYLRRLAERSNLDASTVQRVHEVLGVPALA